jgi:hypothetical protein
MASVAAAGWFGLRSLSSAAFFVVRQFILSAQAVIHSSMPLLHSKNSNVLAVVAAQLAPAMRWEAIGPATCDSIRAAKMRVKAEP